MPKIDVDTDNFIEYRCSKEGLQMLCHMSSAREAVAVGGVSVTNVLEGYFKLVDEAGMPRKVIFEILLPQLEESLNNLGANVKIVSKEE